MAKSKKELKERATQIKEEQGVGQNTQLRVGGWLLDALLSMSLPYDPSDPYEAGTWASWNGILVRAREAMPLGQSPETHPAKWDIFAITNKAQLTLETIANIPMYPVLGRVLVEYLNDRFATEGPGEGGDTTPGATESVAGKAAFAAATLADFEGMLGEEEPVYEGEGATPDPMKIVRPRVLTALLRQLLGDSFGAQDLDAVLKQGGLSEEDLLSGTVQRYSVKSEQGTHIPTWIKIDNVWHEATPRPLSDFEFTPEGEPEPVTYILKTEAYVTGTVGSFLGLRVTTSANEGLRWRFPGELTWRDMTYNFADGKHTFLNNTSFGNLNPSSQDREVQFQKPGETSFISRIIPAGTPIGFIVLAEGTTQPIPDDAVISTALPASIRSIGFSHTEPDKDSSFWFDADGVTKMKVVPVVEGTEWTGVDENGNIVSTELWLTALLEIWNTADAWDFVARFNKGSGTGLPPGSQFYLLVWNENSPNIIYQTPVWTVPNSSTGIVVQNLIHETGTLKISEIWGRKRIVSGISRFDFTVVGTNTTEYQFKAPPSNTYIPTTKPYSPVSSVPPSPTFPGTAINYSNVVGGVYTEPWSTGFRVEGRSDIEIPIVTTKPIWVVDTWVKIWDEVNGIIGEEGEPPVEPELPGGGSEEYGPPWQNVLTKQVPARIPSYLSIKVLNYNGTSDIATFGGDVGLTPPSDRVIKWRVNLGPWQNLPINVNLPKGTPHIFGIIDVNPTTPQSDWTRNGVGAGDRARNESEQAMVY